MATPSVSRAGSVEQYWYQKVEVRSCLDSSQKLASEVFRIGYDQRLTGLGIEDIRSQAQ
jgi:hypothetical protein